MKAKRRKLTDRQADRLFFCMLCEGIVCGDREAERLMVCLEGDDGYEIAAHVRYGAKGPAALIPARVGGGWSFAGAHAGTRLTLATSTGKGIYFNRAGQVIQSARQIESRLPAF